MGAPKADKIPKHLQLVAMITIGLIFHPSSSGELLLFAAIAQYSYLSPMESLRCQRFKRTDPLIAGVMHTLMRDVEQGILANRLYTDTLANALALHLIKNYSAFDPNPHFYLGGLSPSKLRRATDYLNSYLEQNPSLTEVAAVVGVSMHHFARAFKQSTGIPPHRYLMERRVERAKVLLAQTDLPLPEIAFQLGFSSQSHFTTVLRQMTGTTPKNYRKAR